MQRLLFSMKEVIKCSNKGLSSDYDRCITNLIGSFNTKHASLFDLFFFYQLVEEEKVLEFRSL